MENTIEELCGSLEKIIFKNPDTGFIVGLLKINSKQSCTISGSIPQVNLGEHLTLKGNWINHPKFGRQFEVKECVKQLPTNVIGIKKYLSSGMIKGIGPKYAEKLVDRFGTKTLEIIDTLPHKISEVDGIGEKRAKAIVDAWQEQKEISKVMVFLQERDISTDFAVKIFKTYGHASIDIISENPYKLSEDIWGVGFKTADKLALKLGLAQDSTFRIKSGILHTISDSLSNGHLYKEVEDVKASTAEILDLKTNLNIDVLLKEGLHDLYRNEKIKLITHKEKHFLTLPQYYFSEKGIAQKIIKLQDSKNKNEHKFDFDQIYKSLRLPDSKGIELNEDQQKGIISSLQNKVSIITGGPGTGKTTLIKRMLEILDEYKIRYKLAAPTGRAAKRIFEGTFKNAETLHRLLEFTPSAGGFTKNEQNSLELDFLIVDEASMIDVFLMHAILKALPLGAHLILLGDIDQLPSVGAGNILNDLIASNVIATTKLTQIFRQAQDSLIIVNAHKINKGEFPVFYQASSKNDFKYIKLTQPQNLSEEINNIYTKTLKSYYIHHNDAIVLCPMNKGMVGTQQLNNILQQILNPIQDQRQISRFGQIYKINDRVMQIKNNYDKFVFNGDIGFIIDINLEDQKLIIRFGERDLEYEFLELDEITLSYAISIHKSQGSEFKAVIVPLFMQHFIMLQRNLIYTAITRAKELCIFIGETKALAMGIKNNKSISRNTFLTQFLTTNLEAR